MAIKTPKEIVRILNEYIIGQDEAKKSVAIALDSFFTKRIFFYNTF